ncbi:hypothetical protein O3G_MSEX000209 [Manduca sexta]|nr:hypothetical protein O3G_MSEX000209 [Manduca sexta]
MTRATILCVSLAVLLVINFSVSDAARVARSPQRGFSQANAQASAQAGGFGRPGGFGGFNRHRPSFGRGFGGGHGGGSISISKSISISRGGSAQSSASSSARGK